MAAKSSRSTKRGMPSQSGLERAAHYVDALARDSNVSIGRRIRLDRIRPNPSQPRRVFDDLDELRDSILDKGVLEPVLVRSDGDGYILIAGERRFRAAGLAGLRDIPAIVMENATDGDALEIALIENLQRKDLTPFEEADGLKQLQQKFKYTQEDIARKLGKARTSVSETMRLSQMPQAIRESCETAGIHKRSVLLEVLKGKTRAKMLEAIDGHARGGLKREELRRARKPPGRGRPRNFVFRHVLPNRATLELKFSKGRVDRKEIIEALRIILEELDGE